LFNGHPVDPTGVRELPDVSQDALDVWTVLYWRWGRESAIHSSVVERLTGLSRMRVWKAVSWLIKKAGKPIAGSPDGYFLIQSEVEMADEIEGLYSRILGVAARIAALKRITPEAVGGQIAIRLRNTDDVTLE
jgi:hypothetical protein